MDRWQVLDLVRARYAVLIRAVLSLNPLSKCAGVPDSDAMWESRQMCCEDTAKGLRFLRGWLGVKGRNDHAPSLGMALDELEGLSNRGYFVAQDAQQEREKVVIRRRLRELVANLESQRDKTLIRLMSNDSTAESFTEEAVWALLPNEGQLMGDILRTGVTLREGWELPTTMGLWDGMPKE